MNTVNLTIPTDYTAGYAKARLVDKEAADNYIAHTQVGDPVMEAVVEELASLPQKEVHRILRAGMDEDRDGMRNAPQLLREFFLDAPQPDPDWLDHDAFAPGIRAFQRNSVLVLSAFVTGVLIDGFSTLISKSFVQTGRIFDNGVRRLRQNNRQQMEIFWPGGLERYGDGWKLSVRIRIVHAQIRHLLLNTDEWEYEAWGLPISGAHLGYAVSAFSARLLKHMKTLGVKYNDEEYASFMAVWRYTGYLMGIPESVLFHDADEALELYDIGHMCEPDAPIESVVMAHALVNSAPLIAGKTEPADRQHLAQYVYRVSSGLIGKQQADALMYPSVSSFGAIWWFKIQQRYGGIIRKLLPGRNESSNYTRFTALLETSTFDEDGIKYNLPDHVYAEESDQW